MDPAPRGNSSDEPRSLRQRTDDMGSTGGTSPAKRRRTTILAAEGVDAITDEMLDAERGALVGKKQTELGQVFSRHDDLVREKYHMDYYQTLLTYHPVGAKEDHSQAFEEYKTKFNFDLIEVAEPTAGPSRQTRRAIQERKSLVPTPAVSSASAPPKPSKRKGHAETHVLNHEIWDILNDALDKGKRVDSEGEKKIPIKRKPTTFIPPSKRKSNALSSGPGRKSSPLDSPEESVSIVVRRRKSNLKRVHSSDVEGAADEVELIGPVAEGKKKKKQKTRNPDVDLDQVESNVSGSVSAPIGRRALRRDSGPGRPSTLSTRQPLHPSSVAEELHNRSTTSLSPTTSKLPLPESPSVTSAPKLRRITLLIPKPRRTYTNPIQLPFLPPQHGGSLSEFLSSYKSFGAKDISKETLEKRIKNEAEIRSRELLFRKQERYIPRTDVWFGTKVNLDTSQPVLYDAPKRTTSDHWDHIVEAAIANGKDRPKVPLGKHVAGQIAARVQAYWGAQGAKKERTRMQEERRLRALAKTTIKLVVGEWKKVIFHIREQRRLKEEVEEKERGRAHLDAILDQSGQLLSTQQVDLQRRERRPSSRGSSVSERLFNWENDSDSDDDEDVVEEEEEEEEEGGQDAEATESGVFEGVLPESERTSEIDEDEEDEDGTNMLLMDPPPGFSTRTPAHRHSSEKPPSPLPFGIDRALAASDLDDEPNTELTHAPNPNHESSLMSTCRSASPHPSKGGLIGDSATSFDDLFDGSIRDFEPFESGAPPIPSSLFTEDRASSLHRPPSEGKLILPSSIPSSPGVAPKDSDHSPPNIIRADAVSELEGPEYSEGDIATATQPAFFSEDPHMDAPMEPDIEEAAIEEETEETVLEHDPKEQRIPVYLRPFAVAPVEWDASQTIKPPTLLRGVLRPYQQTGMEWLASLHTNNLNGILADEMGLGKTIQTIALLAHLACDRGIWGPHLIIVPTSVILNWEMEFKKFLPGFEILSYHGSTKRRKELRQGWMDRHSFNVCITSYTLASRDAHIFKRKAWYYMILDEAHMIKNFRSQRWNILLLFRSFRRLLLTGTPLQNNLTELWALLQFLMSGSNFANLKEFGDWFSNPLEKAVEMGQVDDEETVQRVSKLHTVLRPYLLRRLKRDVEKELPSKFDHLVLCPLSKRQRFLYDEFMSRAETKQDLHSGVYMKIANILMQLRKVCNHPDLFEVRPIVTSFAMSQSAIADFEIKELLVRKRWCESLEATVDLDLFGLRFVRSRNTSRFAEGEAQILDATPHLPYYQQDAGEPPAKDFRKVTGFRKYSQHQERARAIVHWSHVAYLNQLRLKSSGIHVLDPDCIDRVTTMHESLLPNSFVDSRVLLRSHIANGAILSYADREEQMSGYINRFAFVTPAVVALDLPKIAISEHCQRIQDQPPEFDAILHRAAVKLQIAFPDPSLLQYDCGKLQRLAELLQEKKAGGHRVLIFTQMTKILDILEIFLNFHGYLYLRLDGATKIEDRHYITERFNADPRVFCFISSSRSGGVGINLTGADTVIFYDSDFNPQMDRQCEDRAHRIGQIRDVHIYRFVSQHTVEEAMLRKANQKRSLDELVIQKGEFDWRALFKEEDESAITRALGEFDEQEDAHAAAVAAREAVALEGADEADFEDPSAIPTIPIDDAPPPSRSTDDTVPLPGSPGRSSPAPERQVGEDEEEDEGGTTVDYMLAFVERDYEFFSEWRI